MGPPEYLVTIELRIVLEDSSSSNHWCCNVCLSTNKEKHKLVNLFEGCLTCGTTAARVTPQQLRKLQAEWEIKKFLENK